MNEKLDKLSTQFQVLQRVVLGRSNEVLGRVLRVEQDVVHVATSLGNAFADSLQVHVEMLGSMVRVVVLETAVCLFLVKSIQITVSRVQLDDG